MHEKNAVLILEAPWNIYEGDINRSSVEPFFQGLAKQSNDVEILHSRFYDVSSFRLAFAALSKHKYKNAIVYVAGHGDGQRVGGAKIIDIRDLAAIAAAESAEVADDGETPDFMVQQQDDGVYYPLDDEGEY